MWIYGNMQLDIEEKQEQMCSKCKDDVNNKNKCIRCGDKIVDVIENQAENIGFDDKKFKELAGDL